MKIKGLGACVALIGLAVLIFAGMAYFELHAAATSETGPSTDSMPLTKIVGPEFFAPGNSATKPAELTGKTFNRIYTIAGGRYCFVYPRFSDRCGTAIAAEKPL